MLHVRVGERGERGEHGLLRGQDPGAGDRAGPPPEPTILGQGGESQLGHLG